MKAVSWVILESVVWSLGALVGAVGGTGFLFSWEGGFAYDAQKIADSAELLSSSMGSRPLG